MESSSVVPRACHNCRVRKIKCNREIPCSNCLTSNISCQPSSRPGRAPSTAPPPAASNNVLRALQDRLEKIENAVVSLSMQTIKSSESPPAGIDRSIPQQQPSPQAQIAVTQKKPWTDTDINFLGANSTFEQQSLHASGIEQLASSDDPTVAEVTQQISLLRHSITTAEQRIAAQRQSFQPEQMLQMETIPSSFTLQIIRAAYKHGSLLPQYHPVTEFADFERLSQRIYFPLEPLTIGEVTSFHGMLSFLMWELGQHPTTEPIEDLEMYQRACNSNFELGIETNEIAAIPSFYNATALCMGALSAQIAGNLLRQNILISVAARHCLMLGYHRKPRPNVPPAEAERRSRLFWHVYSSEASLTLRLGRASLIPDFDVDAPRLPMPSVESEVPWAKTLELFMSFSRLQSQIYSTLYSPASTMLDAERRKQYVDDLAMQMDRWRQNSLQIDFSKAKSRHIYELTFPANDVMYYSVLTLLYRGSTTSLAPKEISPQCFQAARSGLEAHLHSFPIAVAAGPMALHYYGIWILTYSSFTPFIITFLYCIAESDHASLKLLTDVLKTLDQIAATNEGVRGQYNICKSLCELASTYLKSQTSNVIMTTFAEERTIHLPLQMSLNQNWNNIAASFQTWDPTEFNRQGLALDANLDGTL
ncbi:hypothetical protein VHEMI05620 [[Torrubiella] hemipterigena]|uniref:Zn(2)-C6 fungal-type domain-containing protein n=1 Tax=[Torrubiella] hemipterigena TaxID=1531966 RepID=A0A0A1TH40_9HYPO|nr:hypothetical protein VHEMI05620 [[Torrubiella] hemipterigena]